MVELNGKFHLAPPKEGSRRDVDIPRWLFDLLQRLTAQVRRCRCSRRDDGTLSAGRFAGVISVSPPRARARATRSRCLVEATVRQFTNAHGSGLGCER